MTTSAQQSVLNADELACLRAIDTGDHDGTHGVARELAAKGMLSLERDGRARLTPAGRLAIHMPGPGDVPGIDN
ncbi:MAG TPA: hypothetical protein VLK29_01625 [Luteimonas sp.]|nr:hypothetical protein [Luteimonas sp.]